ncbi:thioredoxin family protein [Candidatus Woesebacteria bacterium]|nr:thioredoxin family protein [Candidatus Woesebacteria bacterium]
MKNQTLIATVIIVVVLAIGLFVLKQAPKWSGNQREVAISQEAASDVYSQDQQDSISPLVPYSEQNFAAATARGDKTVIFFHAAWCPTCRAAEADFRANADKIPNNVTIFKADYDTEKELKKKYNVIVQDTFVQVDGRGNEITKWNSGGQGVRTLLTNLR